MGKNSQIEWTHDTFNPWIGCSKVSAGCVNCYAEAMMDSRLQRVKWGPGQPRRKTGVENWMKVRKWNDQARLKGERRRVFVASLADWLDEEVPDEWLLDLLVLIWECKYLDFLLLTKRPLNFGRINLLAQGCNRMREAGRWLDGFPDWLADWAIDGVAPDNVWMGVSVENQAAAMRRIPLLLKIPAQVRFLSCEPLLGPLLAAVFGGIDWVICGGESGPDARPMQLDWARSLRDQCKSSGVAFFFKQWGEWAPGCSGTLPCVSSGGGKMVRVGKKQAGRLLDGREWNQFPFVGRGVR